MLDSIPSTKVDTKLCCYAEGHEFKMKSKMELLACPSNGIIDASLGHYGALHGYPL